jgi:hypothetical protein
MTEKCERKSRHWRRKVWGGRGESGREESSGEVMKFRSPQMKVAGGEWKVDEIAERMEERRGKSLSAGR